MEVERLIKRASPLPWRIHKLDNEGIEIVDAMGNLVYFEDFTFPDQLSPKTVRGIVSQYQANAQLMVRWSEVQAGNPGTTQTGIVPTSTSLRFLKIAKRFKTRFVEAGIKLFQGRKGSGRRGIVRNA